MAAPRVKTKILVDGGDPAETEKVRGLIGFVDGQTTNPSLIAKNPEIMQMIASGHRLSVAEQNAEYKKIVQAISPLVGDAGVSIEVFSDLETKAEQMFDEGKDKFSWVPNAYIKYPCTVEGLKAAQMSVEEGIRVNITLVFSQEQAAAVYAATKDSVARSLINPYNTAPAYISPFVGRLDDRGEKGMDLVKNIKQMYAAGDGHVQILAASIRNLDHLLYSFALGVELATVPTKVLQEWADKNFVMPDAAFSYNPKGLAPIEYREIALNLPFNGYNVEHDLTTKGIQKFVSDYQSTISQGS